MTDGERYRVIVIGAGPAGLAVGHGLRVLGVKHLIIEQGDGPGHVWANLYDSLTLHTGKHMSALPGMPFPGSAPMFVPRAQFVEYLASYARQFRLPIQTRTTATRIERADGFWHIVTSGGDLRAKALIVATGIVSNPRAPYIPDQEHFGGTVTHAVEYRRPAPYAGRRVLVVGVGNTGAEIASELARAGVQVTLAVRSGANVVPRSMFGIPIQYLGYWVRKLPQPAQRAIVGAVGKLTELTRGAPVLPRPAHGPLDAIPVIGFGLVDAIRSGQVLVAGAIESFTESGVRFTDGSQEDFDDVILATGYTAALQPLRSLVRMDDRGFAARYNRVASADQPHLYFVGHNYDATGGLHNIARDAPEAARMAVVA
ncbi:MAG TPA: NAD(P)/FAD-dependent oxidoreductase [Gemmatimonadaceae bacterium]|nr:NAD(P)/FAD-dependent oxidoreductase [Gemmatimonadaceae bacterium]